MAFSSAVTKKDVQGTMLCHVYSLNFASVTSGHIKTGLNQVVFAVASNEVTAGAGKVEINRNAADDAAEKGSILLNGFTSNDTGYLLVYGY